ncbi:transmembrane protein 184c-like [Plasmopara halstedii]|uniref:Transmembrane protein 184c-like n=1 Tax=Plasmopara halstedii TaxID=4781 RepID=A0A0P1ACM5_PLAHL|nr:transmembrane protein 184c-like [Plasmopara halstedii]CEG38292.1 transmembrane protein 184c-like [Plasmopara halstedii]|eukprot:XP_024574661.1 transmembrane protein 184c-like [Plasmopara halstedii]
MQLQTLAYAISGAFTLLAIVLSGWLIWTHLLYNPSAGIRKHVIRILMMVPIYALTSYMALVFNESKLLFETVRDLYEAFALYSFHCFLVEYLGGQSVLASTMRSKPQMTHVFPFCCVRPWSMGGKFLRQTTIGILQYIPIKLLMSIVMLITSLAGVYGEGELMNPFVSYGYVCFILSASQTWALYCLLIFFHGAHEELQPMRPWPKFLAIKAIIFFTYWQSIMISMLKIASALNDFVICVEMLGFAIAHHYAFAIEDFLSPSGVTVSSSNVKAPLLAFFMDAINVTDVSTDLKNSRNEILTKKQALAANDIILHIVLYNMARNDDECDIGTDKKKICLLTGRHLVAP